MVKRAIWWLVALACLAAWADDPEPESESGCVPLVPEYDEDTHVYDDCWEVETWSPPTVVPLFEWEEIYEEAKIELGGGVEPAWRSDCLAGSGGTLSHTFTAPSYTVTKGKIGWKTEATECIPDGGEEEEIDLDVTWKWQGPPEASPAEGTGETATFSFGAATPGCYDVVFIATGTPDREGCPEVSASVTGKISAVSVNLTVPGQLNTCCTPETKSASVIVHTGCDDVEVDGVDWSATPEGYLMLTPNPDNPKEVRIGNIKWYPEAGRGQCDRTCEYEITANVQFSNGESCSVTKSFAVEAVYHYCHVRDNRSWDGDVDFWTSPIFNTNCRNYVAMGGTFRWKFEPSDPRCSGPELRTDCYFYDETMAEELFHKSQYESFNDNPPLEIAIDEVFNRFNFGNNIFCGPSEFNRRLRAMTEKYRIANDLFQEQMGYDPEAGLAGPLRCRLEMEAKNAANRTYFYTLECTYPLCN